MGQQKVLQSLFVQSDKYRDTHGFILCPENAFEIGKAIVSNNTSYYARSRAAAMRAGELMLGDTKLQMSAFEKESLESAMRTLEDLPDKEEDFISECNDIYKKLIPGFNLRNYGL